MRIRKSFVSSYVFAAVIAFAASAFPAAARAGLALDLQTGGNAFPAGNVGVNGLTFGWRFTLSSAIDIDGLGVWDANSDGLGTTVPTGLWTDAGVLLASTTVTDSSTVVASASADGRWLFESIDTLTLTPGNYRIGALFGIRTPLAQVSVPFTTIPEISGVQGIRSGANSGFTAPLALFNFPVFGPTMRVVEAAAVPEPSTVVSAVMGAVGSVVMLRRRNIKTA